MLMTPSVMGGAPAEQGENVFCLRKRLFASSHSFYVTLLFPFLLCPLQHLLNLGFKELLKLPFQEGFHNCSVGTFVTDSSFPPHATVAHPCAKTFDLVIKIFVFCFWRGMSFSY